MLRFGGIGDSRTPGKVGGHKKRTLSGEPAAWLRERCRSGPFTTRGLTAELLGRGIKSDRRALWVFLHAEGLIPTRGLADSLGLPKSSRVRIDGGEGEIRHATGAYTSRRL